MGILIDTSVLIAAEKKNLELSRLYSAYPDEEFALSVITYSELLHGYERAAASYKTKRKQFIDDLISVLPVLSFGFIEAETHARIWAELAARGLLIGAYDLVIAATALHHNFSLATLNSQEFSRIEKLQLVNIAPFLSIDAPGSGG